MNVTWYHMDGVSHGWGITWMGYHMDVTCVSHSRLTISVGIVTWISHVITWMGYHIENCLQLVMHKLVKGR